LSLDSETLSTRIHQLERILVEQFQTEELQIHNTRQSVFVFALLAKVSANFPKHPFSNNTCSSPFLVLY